MISMTLQFGKMTYYRPPRKSTTDEHCAIDIRKLKKDDLLQPRKGIRYTWNSRWRQPFSAVVMMAAPDELFLHYEITHRTGKEVIDQFITLETTPCHFGGYRYWMRCPGCNRRITTVYLGSREFRCRHCLNLTYATQQQDAAGRAQTRVAKAKKMLGWKENPYLPRTRPKWMRHKRYSALLVELVRSSELVFQGMLAASRRMHRAACRR